MKNMKDNLDFNVLIEKDEDGNLKYTREAAHSRNRILYSGDKTGKEIFRTMYRELESRDNIEMYEGYNLLDIVSKDNSFVAF